MYQASTGFINALRFHSQLAGARLTVYSNGVPTQFLAPLASAQITVDRLSAQRRQGTITVSLTLSIPPPPLLPTNTSSPLAPFGNEVFLEYGLIRQDGIEEFVPLGLFALATSTVDYETSNLTVTLQVFDRSWIISQRALLAPYNFPAAGGNFVNEIEALLNQVWGSNIPALSYNITPTTATVPTASYNEGSDPWQAAQDMADAVGYELFFDLNGTVVGYPTQNPNNLPVVWQFADGSLTAVSGAGGSTGTEPQLGSSPYTTPVAVAVTMTRDRVFNDFIVTGVGSGNTTPVRGESKDTNVFSPTYVGGPVGDIPSFVSSNIITGTAQANQAAATDLQQSLSQVWQISVSSPPNPLFDIDDVVQIFQPWLGLSGVSVVIDNIMHVVRYDAVTVVTGRVFSTT